MNGAESLIKTLVASGVDVCFTNPGTSEMHFVAALDEVHGMRCILCLFEGGVSGAAYGYGVMAGTPASTLLHLGPGFGNALANIHNTNKGHVPLVNIVGDHATYHLQYDAPLTSDIEGIAGPVSHWVHTSRRPDDIARDAAEAVLQAGHYRVATLVLPADVSWGDNPEGATVAAAVPAPPAVDDARLERAVAMLGGDRRTVLLIGGREVTAAQLDQLGRISSATGARGMTETFPSRLRRGAGTAALGRVPYLAEHALEVLKDAEQVILLGAAAPVSFFAYPELPSVLTPPECEVLELVTAEGDIDGALAALVARVGAADSEPERVPSQIPEAPVGDLNPEAVGQALAHFMPEEAIVVDEAITSGHACLEATIGARQHDWLNLAGGSIGWGLPAAVGAAVACPDRKVICLEGDGSAMYTIQSLWTMARENLDVTVVLFNNQKYCVLELEFMRTGARGGKPGPKAASSLAIGDPDMDFKAMAEGMGVPASVATTAEEFNAQFAAAMETPGPRLIDARVPPLDLG
jgi:acetolactate synthase-1/2/3 large subunit